MKQRCNILRRSAGVGLIACWTFAAFASIACGDDWPFSRGNVFGSGVAEQPLPRSLDKLWTYNAAKDAGFDATAVVANGIVYIGDDAGTFYALHLANGQPAWTKSFPDTGFGAAAAVDKDYLYVGDMNGAVRCLATADGSEIWKKQLESEIYAGPTTVGDDVLVTTEGGKLTCLKKADGEQRWQFSIEAPLRCSPTIAAGRVMLAGCDAKLHFIDIESGREVGTVDIDAPTGSTAAVSGDRIFFGTEGGTFYAIHAPARDQEKPAEAWTYRDPRRPQPIRAAAAVTDKLVVYGSQGKAVYALDPASGKLNWKEPFPTRTRVESAPVIAGDRIVAAAAGGILYVLDAASGELQWHYEAGGRFTASPVVVDGKILLGNGNGTLYCFGSPTEKTKQITAERIEDTEKQ